MASIRCPNCGFVNFSRATNCRRCQTDLPPAADFRETTEQAPTYEYRFTPYTKATTPGYLRPAYNGGRNTGKGFAGGRITGAILLTVVIGLSARAVLTDWKLPLFSSYGGASTENWREFRLGGNATLKVPGEPEAKTVSKPLANGGAMEIRSYTVDLGDNGNFYFGQITYSQDITNKIATLPPQELLEAALDNTMRSTDSTLINKEETIKQGYPGLIFEAKPPARVTPKVERAFGRLYLVRESLYVQLMTVPDSSPEMANKNLFFDFLKFD